jgi:hypothetical protein
MSKAKPIRLGGLLVLAAALAVVGALSLGHAQPGTSEAGGTGGSMAVDCDTATAGVQSECMHAPGSTYVVNYLPTTNPAEEASWGSPPPGFCGVPARSVGADNVLFGCIPFPLPTTGITDAGTLTFSFNCKTEFPSSGPPGLDPDQSFFNLVPREGDPQLGSHFLDGSLAPIDPALSNATVTCQAPPVTPTTPTEEPPPGSPTPGPTTEPPKCGPSGCVEISSGDQTIAVGESTVLVFTVTDNAGNPVDGVDCTFSIVSGGGSLDPTTDTSEQGGNVSTTYTAGSTPETVQIEVDCGAEYGSQVIAVEVSAAELPGTGVGDTSDNGLSTTVWAIAGIMLAAAVAGMAFFGWRYAREDRRV